MTLWYSEQDGGTLIEEFPVVPGGKNQGKRALDGLILTGESKQRLAPYSKVDIEGKDVHIVQAKDRRLA